MGGQFQTRQIQFQVQIGNVTIPANAVSLSHTIDSLPVCEVSMQLDNRNAIDANNNQIGAVDINLSTLNTLNKSVQERLLNQFTLTPNMQISLIDGDGNPLLFKCFEGQPSFKLQNGELILAFTGAHPGISMQAFNAQIYSYPASYGLPFLSEIFISNNPLYSTKPASATPVAEWNENIEPVPLTDSIASTISTIIQALMNRATFPSYLENNQYSFLPVHNLNGQALPQVLKMLKDSTPLTTINGISDPAFFPDNLFLTIYQVLTSSTNFLEAITAFREIFWLQYNADWDGSHWLELIQTLDDPVDRIIAVPVENIHFNMANVFEPPLLQAIVQSFGNEAYGLQGEVGTLPGQHPISPSQISLGELAANFTIQNSFDNTFNVLQSAAQYPSTVAQTAGLYYVLEAPSWLAPYDFNLGDLNLTVAQSKLNRFSSASNRVQNMRDTLQAKQKLNVKILNYMAKQAFTEHWLKYTTASLTIPMNVLPRVGRTYTVMNVDKTPLFVGYLHSVNHSAAIGTSGGSATTTMTFTHIRVSGASINAIDGVLPINPANINVPQSDLLPTDGSQSTINASAIA